MRSAKQFYVFEKWADAPNYAFGKADGSGALVPDEDKEAYWQVHSELNHVAEMAVFGHEHSERLIVRPKQYSRERGSRGHRPKDLWVSVCAEGAEHLGYMPQIYMIASERGLELGLAVSISEDDYFDADIKERNRSIVPFINSKLPEPSDTLTQAIDAQLAQQSGWHFNEKTRLPQSAVGFGKFGNLGEMFNHLKQRGDAAGGGTATRVFLPTELEQVDLGKLFGEALAAFYPILARCAPTPWDVTVRTAQDLVSGLAIEPEVPNDEAEGKRMVLAEVARRQGQASFRMRLIQAYDGCCAITGTSIPDVLQAAHIRPYNGPSTNKTNNGILLRADIHTLFDLKLLAIDPVELKVVMSARLEGSEYWSLNGRKINVPDRPGDRPDPKALLSHWEASAGIEKMPS